MRNKISLVVGVIKKVFGLLSVKQRRLGVAVFALCIINALFQTLAVFIVTPIVGAMTQPDEFRNSELMVLLTQITTIDNGTKAFVMVCVIAIIVYFIKDVLSVIQIYVNTKYSANIRCELATMAMRSYMKHPYDFFLNYNTSSVIRDVQSDTAVVSTIVNNGFTILAEVLTSFFIVAYIIMVDWKVAVCIAMLAAVCLLVILKILKPILRESGDVYHDTSAKSQGVLLQSIEGIKEVQVMQKQDFFVREFKKYYLKGQHAQVVLAVASSSPTYIIEGVFFTGIISFICVRTILTPEYANNLPILASFLMAAIRILPSIGRISNNVSNIIFALPSVSTIYDAMMQLRKYDSNNLNLNDDVIEKKCFRNELKLENIFWHYDDGKKNVLEDLNLSIRKGESIGIIGESGAGKTTLADIILGLHKPQRGVVKLDDEDIKNKPMSYSKIIGYVPQNVYLLEGTVRENVAFGELYSNEGDIWKALKQAQLDDFIMGLENGLDTLVGERGVKLSGGQRQRIAIARALYRNPQIIVFDEATSALDNETERALMESVERLYGSVTMIIIAHRLTTVKKCDRVIEIVNGSAIEREKEKLNF